MKNLKTKTRGKITVDPTLEERYGDEPLFPHKIERIKTLLKGTKRDPFTIKPEA
ncbi:hypothetical protein SAMN05216167_11372 [Spirosoma endophyticum]|uniref:Uncharacterized protein n=1 Tax=Spirosoma endophyticum TaxID=662367 RepID=A0A1I2A425_9BACT|nr:hypothetical protein SAMN05216167_11372 [Spirosoma endophyticum]